MTLTYPFAYPVADVWRAWTDPAWATWFGSDPAGTVSAARFDVRVGGTFEVTFVNSDGSAFTPTGRYLEIEPQRRLVFTWFWATTPEVVEQIALTFAERQGGTDLTLEHTNIDPKSSHNYEIGWRTTMQKLERTLSREIQTLSSREVYRNPWMRVREDQVLRRNGQKGIYGVVEKADFAVIVPLEGGYVTLVEQYRYPVEGRYWELPQGSWEGESVDPERLARAELQEETGLVASRLEKVGFLHEAYGYSNQGVHIFLAQGLTQGTRDLDAEEHGLVSRRFPIAEVVQMILDNRITDAATVAAFGLLKLKGLLET